MVGRTDVVLAGVDVVGKELAGADVVGDELDGAAAVCVVTSATGRRE
jgi:hypothetical protein